MTRSTHLWLQHPIKAMNALWQGFRVHDPLADSVEQEQERLEMLCNVIGLYKFVLGSFPSRLEELCFNTRDIPGWGVGFIRWRGPDTFLNSFGHGYQYSCENDQYILRSPGLEKAEAMRRAGALQKLADEGRDAPISS